MRAISVEKSCHPVIKVMVHKYLRMYRCSLCSLCSVNSNKPVHVERPVHFSLVVDFEMLLHTEGKDENFHQISGNCSLFFFQYFMTMLCSLAVVAWIGQQVHNLFLTYLIGKCVTCKTDPTLLAA